MYSLPVHQQHELGKLIKDEKPNANCDPQMYIFGTGFIQILLKAISLVTNVYFFLRKVYLGLMIFFKSQNIFKVTYVQHPARRSELEIYQA